MIDRIIEKLRLQISLMITKVILQALDDSVSIQKMKVVGLANDIRTNVDRYQEFGFTSNPPIGSELIMLSIGGSRSHNIGIASEHTASRPTGLQPGEAMMYNQNGDYVKLKADGSIQVVSSVKVSIQSPKVEVESDTEMTGSVTITGPVNITGAVGVSGTVAVAGAVAATGGVSDVTGSMSSMRSTFNSHHHGVTTAPGTTSTPTPTM